MTKIKELPVEERPIEKILTSGVTSLSNEELLAVIINTGSKNKSSKDLAIEILKKSGGINFLNTLTLSSLLEIKGIGKKKATTLLAILELAKRMEETNLEYGKKITSCSDVASFYEHELKGERQEHFYCLYLDEAKKVVLNKLLFVGTLNYSLVHPREIFKYAYLNNATSMIFVHNHPSGNVTPSKNDIELTNHLKELATIHGMQVLDHLIIGNHSYYSFFDKEVYEL